MHAEPQRHSAKILPHYYLEYKYKSEVVLFAIKAPIGLTVLKCHF